VVTLVERATPVEPDWDRRTWFRQIDWDWANLRAAMEWLAGHSDPDLDVRLAAAPSMFWVLGGDARNRQRLLERALQRAPEMQPALRLKALVSLAEALSDSDELEQARAVGDEALNLARMLDDVHSAARCFVTLGWCDIKARAWDLAIKHFEESKAIAWAAGDTLEFARTHIYLGEIARAQRQPQDAAQLFEDAVLHFRQVDDLAGAIVALSGLGAASAEAGNYSRACACLQESLEMSAQLGNWWLLNMVGERICAVYWGTEEDNLLAELLGALDALPRERRRALAGADGPRIEQRAADLQMRLGRARLTAALQRGRTRSFEQTLVLCQTLLDHLPGAVVSVCQDGEPAAIVPPDPDKRQVP
jgi:tetratricopeptide (TPR) repeat protein